jgi:hypothetical protein
VGEADVADQLSLGAAVENALLALGQHGMRGNVEVLPGPRVRLAWERGEAGDPTLYRMVPLRRTSRLPYEAGPLPDLFAVDGVSLLTDPNAVLALRRQVAADLDPGWRHWLRVSPADPRWHRDGLTADCLGMRRWEARIVSWLPWRWLLSADDLVPSCPAMGLVDQGPDAIDAGRRLQRYWLHATARGLSMHPFLAPTGVRDRAICVFRIGRSAPVPRSPRRPVDEILS